MTATSREAAPDNFATACCGRWAADRARFALYCRDRAGRESAWTFWDIQREANRFSNVLAALGVMRGERVALLLPPRGETAALHVACYQMGAVAVPLPPRLDAPAAARAFAAAQADVAVVDGTGQQVLAALRQETQRPRHAIGIDAARADWLRDWAALRPLVSARYAPLAGVAEAPALLLGAAEGTPREVTHAQLLQAAQRFQAAHPGYPQAGDLFWSPADWFSAVGLLDGLLPAWQCGQPTIACDGDFDADAAFGVIAGYDVRNTLLTPQQLEAMRTRVPKPNEKYDCRLRTLATGGAATPEPLAAWLKAELGIAGGAGLA